ncbi:hypothetical protein Tco_0015241 [Tanacetum coccineum]
MEDLKQQYLDEMKTLINGKDYHNGRIDIEIKINELKGNFNEMGSVDSLIMEDEHLDTISETKSDKFIKSSVENLVQHPSESEDEYLDSTPKDVRFDAESYLLKSLVNHDTLMASPPKIDFLLNEFAGELTRLQSIPLGIDNINLDPEGDILFLESLLYDNSFPRPPEAFQANSNKIIESLPISVDTLREEIDILHVSSEMMTHVSITVVLASKKNISSLLHHIEALKPSQAISSEKARLIHKD